MAGKAIDKLTGLEWKALNACATKFAEQLGIVNEVGECDQCENRTSQAELAQEDVSLQLECPFFFFSKYCSYLIARRFEGDSDILIHHRLASGAVQLETHQSVPFHQFRCRGGRHIDYGNHRLTPSP
jgi:hypothetical protein